MNNQEKKANMNINITWALVEKGLLILSYLLGKEGLIEKIKDFLDNHSDAEEKAIPCPRGYTWDGTQCVKDPG